MNKQKHKSEPLYKQIATHIEDQINTNSLKPGDKIPSETELMEHFNVSRMTARSALSGLVSKGLIRRVKGKGSFVSSNAGNTNKASSASNLIGVIVPYINAPHMASLISSIEARANSKHYQMILCNSNNSSEEEKRQVEKLQAQGVDGIILYPCSQLSNRSLVREMLANRVNFVLVDRYYPDINTNYVVSNNEQASFELVSHLLKKGYDNPILITHFHSCITPVYDRWQGYLRAMKEHNKNGYNMTIMPYWLNATKRTEMLLDLLNTTAKPTAIVSVHHDTSLQILSICHKLNIKIPDDIALVGFDAHGNIEPFDIDLTTANQDTHQIGVIAVDHLLKGRDNCNSSCYQTVVPIKINWGNTT